MMQHALLLQERPAFGDGESRRPLRPQDVQADAAVAVDVRMVDASGEGDLRRLERVVGGEVNGEEEHSSLVGGLRRAHDGGLPVEEVVADGARAALSRRVAAEILKLLNRSVTASQSRSVLRNIFAHNDSQSPITSVNFVSRLVFTNFKQVENKREFRHRNVAARPLLPRLGPTR